MTRQCEQLNVIKMFSPYEKNILDRLTAVFSTVSDILQIVVFGSSSRGDSNDGSDLDVLVLVNERDSIALRSIQSLKAKALNDIEDFSYVNVFPVRAVCGVPTRNVEPPGPDLTLRCSII